MPEVLLLDCDGVIRHWDVSQFEVLAVSAGCDTVALAGIAFEPALLDDAMCGRLTAEAWAEEIGRRAAAAHGADHLDVAAGFLRLRWSIDHGVLSVVAAVRGTGRRVAILSNASTRLEADLASEGVDRAVDVVLSSARLGLAKPDPAVYRAAAEALAVDPGDVLFVDDQSANVHAARGVGMVAEVFMGAAALGVLVRQAGLLEG